jgi:glycerate-2-kinase
MIIKNFKKLTRKSKLRKEALEIINEGLTSISPSSVFKNRIAHKNNLLKINNNNFDLDKFQNIYVIGFGKASASMAKELEEILGQRIKHGIVIDVTSKKLKRIKVRKGSHPYLSKKNIKATQEIINMVRQLNSKDLVICLISGGGSALFEKPYNSFINTLKINKKLLGSGASIHEINVIRKHISQTKGGNLAKPCKAKIISLIFSDVPGDDLDIIASGPTVFDKSTIKDSQKIIKKYKLPKIKLYETPKDKKIFNHINNIILLNNKIPLEAMASKAKEIGHKTKIITNILSGEASQVGKKLAELAQKMKKNEVYLFGGETSVTVSGKGKGGRNTEVSLSFLKNLPKDTLLISIGSDGIDNTDAAGAIADQVTQEKYQDSKLNIENYLKDNNSYNFFKKTDDLIFTGPTGSNVADLVLLLKK